MRWHNKSIIDKSGIGEPQASQRRAEFGVPKGHQRAGRGKPASAGAAPANKQKITESRRKEWAAACHGVGRKPGDGRVQLQCVTAASTTHSLRSGFRLFLWLAGVPSLRDSTPAFPLTSLTGLKFRGRADRKWLDKDSDLSLCLMMPMRNLYPLIMLAGSGAYVYQQI